MNRMKKVLIISGLTAAGLVTYIAFKAYEIMQILHRINIGGMFNN
jgi:hypothetical protein